MGESSERRKVVTVLFCDVVGSTALGESTDPEALRALLARYFVRMREIVERHGGTVEKFIGDAVMAVFGVPAVHEDDALRACRAALDMRDSFAELGIEGRIGVSTGEVVTGTEERLATGDAVNVAARLEQAAGPGAVLIGQATLALVGEAVEVGPVEPLELKGKAARVPAYRLLGVREAPQRRHDTPFVGRDRELAVLGDEWQRVRSTGCCGLVTIVGEAGVGKSRLVAQLLQTLGATIVRGRCPPYGEGVTYWPVIDVLQQLDLLPDDEAAAGLIRSLLGETDAPSSAEEIAWAFRKTLEQAATGRPLVVVFDDIQWGEEPFRDLVEHVALLSTGRPILLVCIARPELAERHPAWPVTLRLEPLRDDAIDDLIPESLPGELRSRIARAAGGNPLFIEEMLAMTVETGDATVAVPPTLRALLAARLDQLNDRERSVLERGSVEGEIFHRRAVQALAPDEAGVTPRLAALVRKGLITPDRPLVAGEDGFRFRHLLIRDAAYAALPKARRAELHASFAGWLEQQPAAPVELDELVGYHLEQAGVYHRELGLPRDDALAAAARRRLTAAGRRAARRQDYAAAGSLFERAAAQLPSGELDLALEIELGDVLYWTGRADDALRRADSIAARASAAGDRVGELCGRIRGGLLRLKLQPDGTDEHVVALVDEAVPVFSAAAHDLALYIAYSARADLAERRARWDTMLEAYERAVLHYTRQVGYPPSLTLAGRAACRFFGTTPVAALLAWLDENEPSAGRDHFLRAYRAGSLAMLGRFDEARAILAETRVALAERGGGVLLANVTAFESVWVELWAGNPAAAVAFGAEGWRLYEELGEASMLADAAGHMAFALLELDRLEEADAWAGRAAALGASVEAEKEMLWRRVRAGVLARRAQHVEAERLAREAAVICDGTEMLNEQGNVYADLGEVLLRAGKPAEAAAALEQAEERYRRKGNVVSARRVGERLAGLRA